jgi:methionyl-tRNA formyltransferase
MSKKISFVFFGTPQFAADILTTFEKEGLVPSLVITAGDKPLGRKQKVTPPAVKIWAQERNIEALQPKTLRDENFVKELKEKAPQGGWDVFVVAAYTKLIPSEVFDMPKAKTLNVHPSLLPKLRGPSPIKSAVLAEDETGVTIMQIDEELDHGPLVATRKLEIPRSIGEWPVKSGVLEKLLAEEGGKLLCEILPDWVAGKIKPQIQNHEKATFTKKFTTEDGLINLEDDASLNYRKILALSEGPGVFFFLEHPKGSGKKIRVIVKDAKFEDGKLVITKVVPEGRREMSWEDFERGYNP